MFIGRITMTDDLTITSSGGKPVREIATRLLEYCVRNDWAGHDPYDALNSRVFRALPFLDFKWPRLVLTQGMKRSPINLRHLMLVPKTHNPKALALFVSASLQLERVGLINDESGTVKRLTRLLLDARIANQPYSSWGYSFDWQTRTRVIPKSCPNIICTTFGANALLDAFEAGGGPELLDAASSAASFILTKLYQEDGNVSWFNYTPLERNQVHNANLLGAALLCRVAACGGNDKFREPALRATRFSTGKQTADGAWFYGERATQQWIDNFHTGFNLCALRDIARFARTDEFDRVIRSGLKYYVSNFFDADGAPKYFHDRRYPLDVHSVAQAIITLLALQDLDAQNVKLANRVLDWSIRNMWDERGYFYFQKHRYWTNRIPYLRWGQAWMLLALASVLEHNRRITNAPAAKTAVVA
jgi:hypothetical protein